MTLFIDFTLFAQKEFCHANSVQKFQIFHFPRIKDVFLSLKVYFHGI